jgi:hypothetical protein
VNGRAVALGLCVLATVLGCSAEESGSADRDGPAPTISGENLTGAQVCEMVPRKFVQDRLGITMTDSRPWDRDKKPVTIAACRYGMADTPDGEVSVEVSIWPGRVDAKERVKLFFTGLAGERENAEYEEVDGLGDAAAFGPRGVPNVYALEVVTAYEDAYRDISVGVSSPEPPTIEQLRPIAERVLAELDG